MYTRSPAAKGTAPAPPVGLRAALCRHMEPFEPVKVIWQYRVWLAAVMVVAGLGMYLYAHQQPQEFTASALGQVVSGRQTAGDFVDQAELLHLTSVYVQLARTRPVADAAAAKLSGVTSAQLTQSISISQRAEVEVMQISAKSRSSQTAAAEANAYASALSDYVDKLGSDQRTAGLAKVEDSLRTVEADLASRKPTDPAVAILTTSLQALQTKAADIQVQPEDSVRVIQTALPPSTPTSPRPTRDAVLAALVALVLASAGAYVRDRFTDHYQSAEQACEDLDLPKLGEIPRDAAGTAAADEAFRSVRTSLEFALRDRHSPVLVVTSPNPGSGKTHVTTQLARAFAAGGRRVIAVDGDLRRPALHQRAGLPLEPGLGDVLGGDAFASTPLLANEVSLSDVVSRRGGDLDVVTAGRHLQDPAEALESRRMAQTIDALRDSYDAVFVDSPPVLAVVDPIVLSRYAEGVILVVDAQRDRKADARRAMRTLSTVKAPVIGLVFNGAKSAGQRYAYYRMDRPAGKEAAS